MKRFLGLISLSMLLIVLDGCERTSIDDAKYITSFEQGKAAIHLNIGNQQKETKGSSSAGQKYTLDMELESEQTNKIVLNAIGDKVELGYMTCEVSDVLVSNNVSDIYGFTDEYSANIIFNDIINDFGPKSELAQINGVEYISERGELNSKFNQVIFVKANICNGSDENTKICLTPSCYKKTDSGYAYIPNLEAYTTNSEQNTGEYKFFYQFAGGEEKEFVMALMSVGDLSGEDVYINADFVLDSGFEFSNGEKIVSDPKILHSKTQFINIVKSNEW